MATYVYAVIVEHKATGRIERFSIESVRKIPDDELDQLAYDNAYKFQGLKTGGCRREDFRVEVELQRGNL